MQKSFVSLKQMAEDKALDSVSKVTSFAVDPRAITRAAPGVNRPIDWEYVRQLADAYKRGANFPALDVIVDGNKIVPADGQHRHEAALLAISEGAEIRSVECRQFRGNDADMVLLQIGRQEGLKMAPLVLADRYRKLAIWGWTNAQIAERAGKSQQHVRDTMALLDADPKAQKMLEKGQVSADVVRTAVRKHGSAAGDVLAADLERAQADGKTKVTAKTSSAKPPSKLQTAMSLLERLRDAVDAMDGTSVENETLVDDYRAFMGNKG